MRIGLMCHASFGGSARIATELSTELARRGHRVYLFSRTPPFGHWDHDARGPQWRRLVPPDQNGLHPAILRADWSTGEFEAGLSRLLQVIVAERLDILHFHYAVPFGFLAAEVKRRLGRWSPRLIGTLHGTDVTIHGRDPLKGSHLAQALGDIDRLTTVSASHAHLAAEVFGLSPRPEVIPNFVNLSRFRPKKPSPLTGRKPRIVHVSNFRPVKDVQSMIQIFLNIRARMEAELWLIGDGPDMGIVKSMAQRSGFESEVRYWGLRRNVASLLAKADLLLMTSLSESFCLAALEAMACGVPVLATRVGGLPEVVVHEKTGFLFPVGDHDSAARLAVSLLSDPVRHQAMRAAAAEHARRFGPRQIVPVYEVLYQSVLYQQTGGSLGVHPSRGGQIANEKFVTY